MARCTRCEKDFNARQWRGLHLIGYVDGVGGRFEQRACTCRAVLAVQAQDALDEWEGLMDAVAAWLRNGRPLGRELTLRTDRLGHITVEARDFHRRIKRVTAYDLGIALERAIVAQQTIETSGESAAE